ncbi:Alpha-amylase A type-1/2 [Pleodorina starrii]|uniref:alpha-amylase n=1 Tax=Pleodorina starrii TaxID=330485 RepID=A0A9W6BM78_9CHLO|nr:Alpha-amylase A type-1/2 [Pleodorina starrii]
MPDQLYLLDSAYGTKDQLKRLNNELKGAGIKPIADIVINHSDSPTFHGTGRPDTGESFFAAPDLDHTNPELRAGLKDWLNWLKNEIGFEGWRFDFARGYAPQYVREYIEGSGMAGELCIGDYLPDMTWGCGRHLAPNQDAARKSVVDWIEGTGGECMAFDFPLKYILNQSIANEEYWRLADSNGKPPGLIGVRPDKAVTFVANHNTDSVKRTAPLPPWGYEAGYAYILTHPGVPCVFWDHVFGTSSEPAVRAAVGALMSVRIRNAITSTSTVTILRHDAGLYLARIDDKLIVKLGPSHAISDIMPKESDGWFLACCGRDWIVWERKNE